MSSTWLNLLHPPRRPLMNILAEVCLLHNELFSPTAWSHIRAGAHAWTRVRIHTHTHPRRQRNMTFHTSSDCTPIPAVWAELHMPTHVQTLSLSLSLLAHTQTVIWWLWMLMSCCGVYPTRMVGVARGQPPPAFNDVYLAHAEEWKGGWHVCVRAWRADV